MVAVDDPKTLGRSRLSFANEAEIDEFVAVVGKFERGEITPDEWRAFRLVRGTYGQRQDGDAQMLRVKIPQGLLSAAQLIALADVAEQYSRGFGHITTRQNIQFHFVKLHDVELAMRRLAEAGLTTREACGNSVRNITACPYAGVARGRSLRRPALRRGAHPVPAAPPALPLRCRASSRSRSRAARKTTPSPPINDIGWLARVQEVDGRTRRGFRVTVGGGTANLPRAGSLLYDFLPAEDMLNVAEAVLRVFHRLGDYEHRNRNRMKFLIKELGWEKWRQEFETRVRRIPGRGRSAAPVRSGAAAIRGDLRRGSDRLRHPWRRLELAPWRQRRGVPASCPCFAVSCPR